MQPHLTNVLFFVSNLKRIYCYYHLETLHNILSCKLSHQIEIHYIQVITQHTTYSRNNMGQKCEGNCGLWVLNEMILKKCPKI